MNQSSTNELSVSIAPLPSLNVEYYEDIIIPVSITNNSIYSILVESVTFRFQTDRETHVYVEKACSKIVETGSLLNLEIPVSPTPEFRANTNAFEVSVIYKKSENQTLGPQQREWLRGAYLIIKPLDQKLGQLFISVKQPEDLELAKLLQELAEHAGFTVYLATNDPQPGVPLWDRIEPELKKSMSALILWTKHTQWGTGVQHEIELCRNCGIPDILIIEQNLELPDSYKGTEIEYQRFNPDDPLKAFVKVITTQRKLALSKSSVK